MTGLGCQLRRLVHNQLNGLHLESSCTILNYICIIVQILVSLCYDTQSHL